MANKKTVKFLTIAVLVIFIIFMGLSAVMYFAGGTKPATDEQNMTNTEITGEVVNEALVNTGE